MAEGSLDNAGAGDKDPVSPTLHMPAAAAASGSGCDEPHRCNPIFLLSVCPRSGSNYLEALLSLHPHCRKSRLPEDFFLANSETLLNFCRSVAESWDDWWRPRLGGSSRLAGHIGEALLRFADPDPQEDGRAGDYRVILRAPTIDGIEAVSALFPNAQVVVLVRDGPSTVESGRKSFGWPYEEAMLAWRKSVRRILAFLAGADGRNCRLIRFEDLVTDPVREVARAIEFFGLDPALYPFSKVDEVPVLGSSSFGRAHGEEVHWRPVPKDDSFDPLTRAQSWPLRRRRRFAWLAGSELRKMGYAVEPLSSTSRIRHVVLDCAYGACRAAIQIVLLPLREPQVFSDRRRRYLSWRIMTRPGDAVVFAWRKWRRRMAWRRNLG
jgi:protein-tyrosine sulfotransferase